ncbi:MAG: hypothetical protein J6U17_02495 [Kiritimatiellae bacterium]|nr:hypothetical protein [Kiritimatiellia bacterium]
MRAFFSVVALQLKAAARSKAIALLFVASLAWMFAVPGLVSGDGTADGAHQVFVRYSLWGVFVLVLVSLAAAGAGSLSSDRDARRLQLTLVRPARRFAVALGRMVALVAVGASVLAVCALVALCRSDASRRCWHVLSPVMESPRSEAERAYRRYMESPETPDELKKTDKRVLVRILERKAFDRYETVRPGASASWRFDTARIGADDDIAARLRFSSEMGTREDFTGTFALGARTGSVSNITQTVVTVPLAAADAAVAYAEDGLVFTNSGRDSLMLRPRRDVQIVHSSSDCTFARNLAFALVVMVSMLSAVVAFSVFLGAGLGRSPAVFTVMVTLFLAAASPAVMEDYQDEVNSGKGDRVGLALAQFAGVMTRPLGSFSPIGSLADDECVELRDVARAVSVDFVLLPLFFAFLAAFIMPVKQESAIAG